MNEDKRRHERISIQARATVETDSHAGDGLLMDFSSHGLGMLLDHNKFIDIGQTLSLNFETGSRPTTVQGIIKWVRKLKEGKLFDYAVGLEFVDFDSDGYGTLLQHAQT